jgi:hypothetical protein
LCFVNGWYGGGPRSAKPLGLAMQVGDSREGTAGIV